MFEEVHVLSSMSVYRRFPFDFCFLMIHIEQHVTNMLDTRFNDKYVVTFTFHEKMEKWLENAINDCNALQKSNIFFEADSKQC